jgi:uncharacterized protein (TIGR02246 family)
MNREINRETGQVGTDTMTDEAAVRALYQQMMDAWDAGSGDRFAAPFTSDGDFVAFDGVHFRRREQIAAFHQQLFDKWMKGSCLVGSVETVRFVAPDVAVVHAVGNTVMRGKSRPAPSGDPSRPWWRYGSRARGAWRRSTTPVSGPSAPTAAPSCCGRSSIGSGASCASAPTRHRHRRRRRRPEGGT